VIYLTITLVHMQAFFKFFFARRSACYFLDLKINRESQIVTTGGADTATPALGGGHGLVWVTRLSQRWLLFLRHDQEGQLCERRRC
jgi:hypothetical protein